MRQCSTTAAVVSSQTCRVQNLSNPKPGHTTGGSGRSARRSDRAGSGKIGCQQNYSPRKQKSTVPSKASKKRHFNVSPEARTGEILCKPTEEQNQRLTSGLSAVYQQFISGTRSALFSWLPNSGTTPFCLCKPFSCKACPGTRTHNGRVGSARRRADGGVGRRWAEQGADISVALEANSPSGPPAHCKKLSWTSLRKHEQRKSHVNRWRNETSG